MSHFVVSAGDCNGIGLECFSKALQHASTFDHTFTLVADPAVLASSGFVFNDPRVQIESVEAPYIVEPGVLSRQAGHHAMVSLDRAISIVASGRADALITLPVNKQAMHLAGFPKPGHTEYLAEHVGGTPMMILCSDAVRVALVTVHMALRDVAQSITTSLCTGRILELAATLRDDFGIAEPRIAVLALNPHAGEHGSMGTEEGNVIAPAITIAMRSMDAGVCEGPFAADGFFAFGAYHGYDGILAMYHDQGLIPLKMLAKGAGVNVTAGLSIVRTSPDHGTAFEIAGTNTADPTSTVQAITLAAQIVAHRRSAALHEA
jgi:4-hydroxythreonine-4-phosphate dehydrogenase